MKAETTNKKIILIPESNQDRQLLKSLEDNEYHFDFNKGYVKITIEPHNKDMTHA